MTFISNRLQYTGNFYKCNNHSYFFKWLDFVDFLFGTAIFVISRPVKIPNRCSDGSKGFKCPQEDLSFPLRGTIHIYYCAKMGRPAYYRHPDRKSDKRLWIKKGLRWAKRHFTLRRSGGYLFGGSVIPGSQWL